jgi:cell division protein FtsL
LWKKQGVNNKMKGSYVLFFLAILTIPLLWGINVWQSNECGVIRNEIRKVERRQENFVRETKTVAHEIGDLLAIDRLETEAHKLGLQKVRPEDVIVIIMEGKGRGH